MTTGQESVYRANGWSVLWTLFRQDPARRTFKVSLIAAVFLGVMVRAGVYPIDSFALPLSTQAPKFIPLMLIVWTGLVLLMISSNFTSRSSLLTLALPVEAANLWMVRITSIAAAMLLPLVIIILFLSARGPASYYSFQPEVLRIGFRLGASAVLAALICQSPSPRLYRVRGGKVFVIFVALMVVGLGWYNVATPSSLFYTLVPLILALLLGLRIYRSLPACFSTVLPPPVAGETSESQSEKVPSAVFWEEALWEKRKSKSRWFLHAAAWRVLVNNWHQWLMLFLIALYGCFFVIMYHKGEDLLEDSLLLMLWVWLFFSNACKRIGWLDELPLSREVIYAHLMTPVLFALLAGGGIGEVIYGVNADSFQQIYYKNEIHPPLEFWEIAWDGQTPEITSPWGETYTPRAYRIVRGSDAAVYNPFEHGKDNSAKFVALQLERALARVHGADAAPEEKMLASWPDEDFSRELEKGKFTVEGSTGRSELRFRSTAAGVVYFVFLFAMITATNLRRYRAGGRAGKAARFWVMLLFGPLVILLAAGIMDAAGGWTTWWAVGFLPRILTGKLMDILPVDTGILWIAVVISFVAFYLVVRSSFIKIEAQLPGKKKSGY